MSATERNLFISTSRVPPLRWRVAFPQAELAAEAPLALPAGTLLWSHNRLPLEVYPAARPTGLRIVVLYDEPSEEKGLTALGQGAAGYCNAHATPEMLRSVESVVRAGGLWVGEALLARLIGGIAARVPETVQPQENPLLERLSPREREVALAVVRGESNKEIARQFDLAERTIKAHLSAAFEKLGVRDRLQLALLLNTPK